MASTDSNPPDTDNQLFDDDPSDVGQWSDDDNEGPDAHNDSDFDSESNSMASDDDGDTDDGSNFGDGYDDTDGGSTLGDGNDDNATVFSDGTDVDQLSKGSAIVSLAPAAPVRRLMARPQTHGGQRMCAVGFLHN